MWGALIRRIFKRIILRLTKKSMGVAIKAFLARYAIKITKPIFKKIPELVLADNSKIAQITSKIKEYTCKNKIVENKDSKANDEIKKPK